MLELKIQCSTLPSASSPFPASRPLKTFLKQTAKLKEATNYKKATLPIHAT